MGGREREKQDEPGAKLVEMLASNNIAIISTYFSAGKTYYGQKGTATRPDYIAGRTELMKERRVSGVRVLQTSWKMLQAMQGVWGRIDKLPLAMWIKLKSTYEGRDKEMKWD